MDLSMINLCKVGVLNIFELVDLSKLPVEFVYVIDVVFLMVHEVLVGGLFEAVNIGFAEKWIFELLEKLDFIEDVGAN